jgi:hypothetical protein
MAPSVTDSTTLPDAPMPRRRSGLGRFLRISVTLAILMVIVVLAIPAMLSMDWMRERIERQASEAVGAKVAIGRVAFGWFSGVEVEDVAVANPPGFAQEQRLFEMKALRGDADFIGLLRGRFSLTGAIEGLSLRIQQRADGTTNLGELIGVRVEGPIGMPPKGGGSGTRGEPIDFAGLRLDLAIRDAFIEVVHETNGVLERLEHVEASVAKAFGTNRVRFDFACDLARPAGGAPGRLELRVDAQTDPGQPIEARLRAVDLDLARYRPVLATFLPADRVTAFAGVVTANAQITGHPDDRLDVTGSVEIAEPHFAGPLFLDLDLGAPRFSLAPKFSIARGATAGPRQLDLSQLTADLGFLSLRGLPTTSVAGGAPSAGFAFALDLAALAARGGAVPAMFRDSGTRLEGELRVPLGAELETGEFDKLLALLGLRATLGVQKLEIGGQTLGGVQAELGLAGGRFEVLAKSGTYGDGPLQFRLVADANRLDTLPVELSLGVDGAKIGAEALRALQYVFPLAAGAGLAGAAPVALAGRMDLRVELAGPGRPAPDATSLAWLERWSGKGRFGVTEGKLRPAAALAQLLSLTGETGELSIQSFANEFELGAGAILGKRGLLSAKGRQFALSGRTTFAGGLDWVLDVKSLLAEHKDGRRILEFVGDAPIGAALTGSLTAPAFALPPLDEIAKQALQKAIERGAGDLIQKEAGKLLDSLLGGRRDEGVKSVLDGVLPKPGTRDGSPNQAPPNAPNTPIDAARSTLETILQQAPGATNPANPPAGATGPTRPRPDPIGDMLRQVMERKQREAQQQQQQQQQQGQSPPRRDG